jgi:hypothetical protein
LVFSYFYEILQDLLIQNITKFSYFWMSTGFVFYSGGTILVYLFLVGANNDMAKLSWNIAIFLNFLLTIFLSLTFWFSKYLNSNNVK